MSHEKYGILSLEKIIREEGFKGLYRGNIISFKNSNSFYFAFRLSSFSSLHSTLSYNIFPTL